MVDVVGKRVRVLWADDDAWYSGVVTSYSSRRGHCVRYDPVEGEDDRTSYEDFQSCKWEVLEGDGADVQSAAAKRKATGEPAMPVSARKLKVAAAPPQDTAAAAAAESRQQGKKRASQPVVLSENGEDEEVRVSAVAVSSSAVAASSCSAPAVTQDGTEGDNQEDVQFVGRSGELALVDFPHARQNCMAFAFSFGREQTHCPNCYCFVCDAPASTCKTWPSHCKAVHDDPKWRKLREHERGPRKGRLPRQLLRHQVLLRRRLHQRLPRPAHRVR
jgi:hypothetical protein